MVDRLNSPFDRSKGRRGSASVEGGGEGEGSGECRALEKVALRLAEDLGKQAQVRLRMTMGNGAVDEVWTPEPWTNEIQPSPELAEWNAIHLRSSDASYANAMSWFCGWCAETHHDSSPYLSTKREILVYDGTSVQKQDIYIGYLDIEELWGLGVTGLGRSKFKNSIKNKIICDWFTYCIVCNMPKHLFGRIGGDGGGEDDRWTWSWYEKSLVAHAIMGKGKDEAVKAVGAPEEVDWIFWRDKAEVEGRKKFEENNDWLWRRLWEERWTRFERQQRVVLKK
ncbi:hypothetical protein TrST_g8923 [Triparma strigata]|uniref:Uncharacterized protein n=1 Tax=Triparma strigata TaxID=1606541 RepID=A0A9W7AZC0_9STRA|nr:hypothetical protein TrST_g8923 [Triparma strigata]